VGPSADNTCKLTLSKAGTKKLRKARNYLSAEREGGREKGITRKGREELADISCL